jgi:hypothetical protein
MLGPLRLIFDPVALSFLPAIDCILKISISQTAKQLDIVAFIWPRNYKFGGARRDLHNGI